MNNRRHLFHLVNPSPWPILSALSAFTLVSGFAFYMHKVPFAGYLLLFGLFCISYCAFFWFNDIVDEATNSGYHTLVVRMGLRTGFILFVVSEIMLFFGFFWAFFHSALCPSVEVGSVFPPIGVYTIPVFEFPLFTLLFLFFQVPLLHERIALWV